MGYVKYYPTDQKNGSQRMAKANAANLANPETELDDISHNSQISQSEAASKENINLKKYIDELELFSFDTVQDLPPRPPFPDPPERGKAWAAWWSAIDRRNRKFKAGRWEPKHQSPGLRERVGKCVARARAPVHGKQLDAGRGDEVAT
jgi:hypothetical protein